MPFRKSPFDRCLTILLVDDHPALRAGLRSLLSAESDMAVSNEAVSGEDAYSKYRNHKQDVVVMDLSMTGFGGIEAIRRIIQYDAQARILVYSVHTSEVMLHRALSLGALGYVTKGSDTAILVQGIREVAARRGFVSPDLIPLMVRQHTEGQAFTDQLGDREFMIFLLTAEGKKPAECARALNLSEKTIRNYLTQIKTRLCVDDTAELTRIAIRAGLVNP